MDQAQYLKLLEDIGKVKDRIQTLEIQITLMEPVELLKFKAKVLESLKTIDLDLDKFEKSVVGVTDKYIGLDKRLSNVITKIAIYSTIGGFIAAGLMTLLIGWVT